MSKHTKTLWKAEDLIVVDTSGNQIACTVRGNISIAECEGIAKDIAHCHNIHDELVNQLRYLIYSTCSECKDYNTRAKLENNMCMSNGCDTINRAQELLKRAKTEEGE
ncbi:hypothetical protein LCGC14_2955910 [marine sediment metagenome]|uniref:Uncharacterized protein n=1 Tax=marine sediment metagenome TaxID=412755 RepID=A0A0F8XEG9_9ZZZZ